MEIYEYEGRTLSSALQLLINSESESLTDSDILELCRVYGVNPYELEEFAYES
jgi:hypothetical protein